MKILIMRHGEAGSSASSDEERSLTERGRSESVSVVKQLVKHGVSRVDLVLVSPYLRAQQTWEEIKTYLVADQIECCDDITPYGQSNRVFDYVLARTAAKPIKTVLLISHLPLVGYLTSEFISDMAPPMFATSVLAGINFDPKTEHGSLLWHIKP
jgi:phosphohistidine phosphatase